MTVALAALRTVVGRGQSETLELTRSTATQESAGATFRALSNWERREVPIGLAPDGKVVRDAAEIRLSASAQVESGQHLRGRRGASRRTWGLLDARHSACSPSPQALHVHVNRLERRGTDHVFAPMRSQQHPIPTIEAVDLERFGERVQEPQVGDARAGVHRQLLGAVEATGRWGEDLTDPVGREREVAVTGRCGQSLSPPPGEVGYDDVVIQVDLRFLEHPPAARASFAKLHGWQQGRAKHRRADGLGNTRSWADLLFSWHELADHVLGQRCQVLVRPRAWRTPRHESKVARRAGCRARFMSARQS
jgi:hypothetical protein